MFTFAFSTGIECSAPLIDGGRKRIDQFEKCGFYEHWRTDFELVKELGLEFLRFGPPLHRTWPGDGKYDWEFADATFKQLRSHDLVPIVDLCHFGLPDWMGVFQNPTFPGYCSICPRLRGSLGAALYARERAVHAQRHVPRRPAVNPVGAP